MGRVNSLRQDMQNTPSYRLGRRMAENGKPRPAENILTFYRANGHSTNFLTEARYAAAAETHRLRLMGWDDFHSEARSL